MLAALSSSSSFLAPAPSASSSQKPNNLPPPQNPNNNSRAPIQRLDMRGRPGLLRTTLEAQETRGLTRSGDLGRLLPAEAATLARGRRVRQSRLLFFARLAEQGLQTYQRDGWGEFPTRVPAYDRREVRPTADRGPILLCVDTSGSMRGARETVAKALALECMRAAREQERGCYVFAFAGPKDVRELELGQDAAGVSRLLDFVEATFNGGSDFNEPLKRCLDRLSEAEWANSDVLLVSGEWIFFRRWRQRRRRRR